MAETPRFLRRLQVLRRLLMKNDTSALQAVYARFWVYEQVGWMPAEDIDHMGYRVGNRTQDLEFSMQLILAPRRSGAQVPRWTCPACGHLKCQCQPQHQRLAAQVVYIFVSFPSPGLFVHT